MISLYIKSITTSLYLIHTGKFLASVKATLKLSFLLSIPVFSIERIIELFTNWTIQNELFIIYVLGAIAIDHILGTFKHWLIDNDFSFFKNLLGIFKKIGLTVAIAFLFEGLNEIVKEQSLIKEYLTVVTKLVVFLYPTSSALGNSSALTDGKFPPKSFLDKITKFFKTMKPNDLINKKEE